MAAAGLPPWANSNLEEAPTFNLENEEKLMKKVKENVTNIIELPYRSRIQELEYTITVFYSPTGTSHKCILNIIIPKKERDDDEYKPTALFQIIKPGEYPCISIEYDATYNIFHQDESKIEQNSRVIEGPRCFHPAVPDGKGVMTDFLQILSTKLKLRYGSWPIRILDAATAGDADLRLFTYRFMRGHNQPSIYQRYGFELQRSVYWQALSDRLQTLTLPELREDIVTFPGLFPDIVYEDAFKYPLREEEAAVIDSLSASHNITKPIPEILKDIPFEEDADGGISNVLFNRIRVFYYLWSYQASNEKTAYTTHKILTDLSITRMENILKRGYLSPIAMILEYELPLLQLNKESQFWKDSEKKLLITNIEYGDTIIRVSSGGYRRKTIRKRASRRKRRSTRQARKVDRVRA